MLRVKTKTYSGCFGTSRDVGNIIHVNLKVDPGNKLPKNKEIILLIDISASMEKSMKIVKSSLLAFRDFLVEKSPEEMEKLSSDEKD